MNLTDISAGDKVYDTIGDIYYFVMHQAANLTSAAYAVSGDKCLFVTQSDLDSGRVEVVSNE